MKAEVATAIEELRRQFVSSAFTVREDEQGGAYVVMDPVSIGAQFVPTATWMGFHIPAQYPYADIYPVFLSGDVRRANGIAFQPPVTSGHNFENRGAIQISRRSAAAQTGTQRAVAKLLKVLDFLEKLP